MQKNAAQSQGVDVSVIQRQAAAANADVESHTHANMAALKAQLHKEGVKGSAEGGIFMSPAMGMIGEAGPEAVIPLDILANSPLVDATKEAVESNAKVAEELAKLSRVLRDLPSTLSAAGGSSAFGLASGTAGGGGQGYSASSWGNVSAYDDAFREASAKSGIPFNTLKGIALQEGVDPRDNNSMGIRSGKNGLNADHFSKEEAKAHIIRQAMLPYMQGFRDDAAPEQRRKAYSIYTPVGAANDRRFRRNYGNRWKLSE